MDKKCAIKEINYRAKKGDKFLFIIDYEMQNCIVADPDEAFAKDILFNFNNIRNFKETTLDDYDFKFERKTVSFSAYKEKFYLIQEFLKKGDTYLVNLTLPTPISTNLSLNEIFHRSEAKYKLLYKNEFVFFSPEIFIKTKGNKIFTHPMKGTIDAAQPNASESLLSNAKEQAEHATIVDLLRNDLSMVARNVRVEKFRYIDEVISKEKKLLQVSSMISGDLDEDAINNPGEMIFKLLPAGSVTGAPKKKTLEIIKTVENYERGFYTGIAGYFDGKDFDCCVIIRYIESIDGLLTYKSGGGITAQSDCTDEYNELINKIYVPINRSNTD